jgi:hypothetical protein
MMENWVELRRNHAAHSDFYTYFVRAIVGKGNFNKRLRSMAEGAEIATISDKALALIGVENGHRVWDDVFENSKGGGCSICKDGTYPEEWKSNFLPTYTRASKDHPSPVKQNAEDKHWSQDGIIRASRLHGYAMCGLQ